MIPICFIWYLWSNAVLCIWHLTQNSTTQWYTSILDAKTRWLRRSLWLNHVKQYTKNMIKRNVFIQIWNTCWLNLPEIYSWYSNHYLDIKLPILGYKNLFTCCRIIVFPKNPHWCSYSLNSRCLSLSCATLESWHSR